MNNNVRSVLKVFGEETIAEMIGILHNKNKEARGKLLSSLKTELKEGLEELVLQFSMEDYGKWVDGGRRAGKKQPPIKNIEDWCEIKGIDKKFAYPIARKIAKEGIPATDFFEVPLRLRIEMLKNPLSEAMRADFVQLLRVFRNQINNEWQLSSK